MPRKMLSIQDQFAILSFGGIFFLYYFSRVCTTSNGDGHWSLQRDLKVAAMER